MKKEVSRVLVMVVVLLALCASLAQAAVTPMIWLDVSQPSGGASSSIGCGLSNTAQTYSRDVSSLSAKISIDDFSGETRWFSTKPWPAPQNATAWSVWIWTSPDYQSDTVRLHWGTPVLPDGYETQFWFLNGQWPSLIQVSGNWHTGAINLSAIKTDDWHKGLYGQVEVWNTNPVPEPSGLLALGGGLLGLGAVVRRRLA